MALFFDSEWFDARLAAAGLTRDAVAAALGLSRDELREMWKDQRELSPSDVRILSGLLGASAGEIASRAGISTPVPREAGADTRLQRIERELAEIKSLLLEMRAKRP
jgi:transcriptional regulator with XRE-family HTH domain